MLPQERIGMAREWLARSTDKTIKPAAENSSRRRASQGFQANNVEQGDVDTAFEVVLGAGLEDAEQGGPASNPQHVRVSNFKGSTVVEVDAERHEGLGGQQVAQVFRGHG
jgi:hypothetical protein